MADADSRSPQPAGWREVLGALIRLLRRPADEAVAALMAPPETGGELVEQARAFQDLTVADVMTPRADILAIDAACTFDEVVHAFIEAEHSRMPVYRETLDDPVGVVHVKDIFKLSAATPSKRPKGDDPVLQRRRSLIRKPLYVPGSMPCSDLMRRMRASRMHLALVIDEFGGTDGLVTLEDLLESLVGEIEDEHDDEADGLPAIVEDEDGWEVDGRTLVKDLETAMGEGVDLAPPDLDEEIDTVAGLVTTLAGRVPHKREVIAHPGGYALEVVSAVPRRVTRVRVRRAPPAKA